MEFKTQEQRPRLHRRHNQDLTTANARHFTTSMAERSQNQSHSKRHRSTALDHALHHHDPDCATHRHELRNSRAQEGDTTALLPDIHSIFMNEPAPSSHIDCASINKFRAPHGQVASSTIIDSLMRALPLTTAADVGAHSLSATPHKKPYPGELAICSATQQLQRKPRRIGRRALKPTIQYDTETMTEATLPPDGPRTRARAKHQSRKHKQSQHQLKQYSKQRKQTQPSASTTTSSTRTQDASTSAATSHAHSISSQTTNPCALQHTSTHTITGAACLAGPEAATSGGEHTPSGGQHTPITSLDMNEPAASVPDEYHTMPKATERPLTANHGATPRPTASIRVITGPAKASTTYAGAPPVSSDIIYKEPFDIIDMAIHRRRGTSAMLRHLRQGHTRLTYYHWAPQRRHLRSQRLGRGNSSASVQDRAHASSRYRPWNPQRYGLRRGNNRSAYVSVQHQVHISPLHRA